MLDVHLTSNFRRDYRRMVKRGMKPGDLKKIVDLLRARQPLPFKHRDHALTGDYEGFRECHIKSDWLLVYRVDGDKLILVLFRTGSHSDLF